ncbi:hypothetical protein GUJ93_ZPchr0458g22312 [Zizania palustris]|uniref:C2H2-type domain-containing protein n=1 Tax=Zizania palustris TaxID=103762 RepID=A0A8J5RSR7_ZIZPA|nr:hypothetical protein GUJ93_ZPchr0458g22312 [Zizania palustris]
MVEPGRAATAREAKKSTTTTASSASGSVAALKKKLLADKAHKGKEMTRDNERKREMRHRHSSTEPESPSYRLALRSFFSCRNSGSHRYSSHCKKLKDNPPLPRVMHRRLDQDQLADATAAPPPEPYFKRRASASACNSSSERSVKKPLKQEAGSLSSEAGGSCRLRRLSGCYECHMVVEPISGALRDNFSMRATICSCPDCGEIFVRAETLQLHQAVRHAVAELGPEDTSRNIIEIIFQSSWLKKQSPVCAIDRILKVHNAPRTLARFEDYRHSVKTKAATLSRRHPRCTADGNELLRFHCATLSCALGLHGATHLCDDDACGACAVIRDGFSPPAPAGGGIRTMATSGRAHDAVADGGERRAMLVCRVIAGRVRQREGDSTTEEEYDSAAGTAGVYSNLDELEVFNPTAILPCFVVVYRAD